MISSSRYPCLSVEAPGFPLEDDPVWDAAVKMPLVDVLTGEKPFLQSEFCILRDDPGERFLIRFSGEDDGAFSLFRLRDEPLARQDVFGLLVADTDSPDLYKDFQSSPWDVLYDGLVKGRSGRETAVDLSFDAKGWKTRTVFDRRRLRIVSVWSLPYSAFSQRPAPGTGWRFNAFRIDHSVRGISRQAWVKTGKQSFHDPEHFGLLDFAA